LRAKLGESLRRIQGEQALTDVTTQSLDALRLYAQAIHVGDDLGDVPHGVDLMQQAVQKDSTFAMAWRKLGSWTNNSGDGRAEIYAKKAVDNAAHLSTHERYNAIASLHTTAGAAYDLVAAIEALRRAIENDSLNSIAIGNMAIQLSTVGQLDSAIVYGRRAVALGSTYGSYHLALFYLEAGRMALGDSAMEEAHRRAPGFAYRPTFDVMWYHLSGHYDSAAAVAKSRNLLGALAAEQMTQGQLHAASSTLLTLADKAGAQGLVGPALDAVASASWIESTMRGRPAVALSQLVDAEKKYPIEREPLPHRPYYQLATAYAMAGNTTRAHELIRDGDRLLVDGLARWNAPEAVIAKSMVALAEKRPRDAVAALEKPPFWGGTTPRNSSVTVRVRCALPFLALAYDRAGNADSARAVFQRYVDDTFTARFVTDEFMLADSRQRLGELFEAKGDRAAAKKYYSQLLAQWKNADPELAPRIADITRRVSRLSDTERR
jgi:tetratricopeptide (TPR) repeat protein